MTTASVTGSKQKPRVVLIDDDGLLLRRTNDYLSAHGYDVTFTDNLFGIPGVVNEAKPDLIVLDVRMPALSGDGVATTLARMCDVPIIFYSAVPEGEGAALARQHERASFVSKANGLRALLDALNETLRGVERPVAEAGKE